MAGAADPVSPAVGVAEARSPAGGSQTVTLVLTDVEGSTRLWAAYPDVMSQVMGRHHEIVHAAVTAHGGWRPVDQGEGDAVFAAFDSATAAVQAVIRFQRELAAQPWPTGIEIGLRVGVHTGEVTARDGNLFGSTVNRCARLRGLGAGGQVLLSAPTWELVRDRLPEGVGILDLGEHRMKDLTRPEHVHQLLIPGLPSEFPPLASLDRASHNLPVQTSSFLGRDREVTELVDLVGRERLVTIVGFGGMGKTRLALQVAAEMAVGDGDGVWFIDLSAVTEAGRIPSLIATTLGVTEGLDGPLPALLVGLRGKRLLLVLDNLQQLLPDAAAIVDRIVSIGSGLRVLVTSREPLRLQGEQVYALPSLPVPPPPRRGAPLTEAELGSLSTYAAVALFISRATAARRDFTLNAANAPAIAAICVRLDGLPLALELAAARTRLLSPEALLPRLDQGLKILIGGNRNLPTRHQTLRATIAWSYDALDRDQQQLLDRLSIFPGSFTLDAAEAICGPALTTVEDDLDVLEGMSVLVDRSLARLHPATSDQIDDRYSLLVSIRDYAAEHLEQPGSTVLATRHLAYYTQLTALPPDRTPEDEDRLNGLTGAELHNLRWALEVAHNSGTAEQEIDLASRLVRSGLVAGRLQECTAISDRALSRGGRLTSAKLSLLSNLQIEHQNAGTDRAGSLAEQVLAAARQLGERSQLAAALIRSWFFLPRAAVKESIAEVRRIIDLLPPTGNQLPRWLVERSLDNTLCTLYYVEPDLALQAGRRSEARDTGLFRLIARVNLCELLLRCGVSREAESAAAELESSVDLAELGDFVWSYGMLTASQVRLSLRETRAARSDLDRIRTTVDTLALPALVVWADVLQAGILRVEGRLPAAREILRRTVHHPPAGVDRAYLARARWLLAVVLRESGDATGEVLKLLESAWRDVAGSEVLHLDLILVCLLERALQLADSDPAEAARFIGLVNANRGTFAFIDGVQYDTEAMLDGLRARLGSAEVDKVLAGTVDQTLPNSPTWDYVDDSEEKA